MYFHSWLKYDAFLRKMYKSKYRQQLLNYSYICTYIYCEKQFWIVYCESREGTHQSISYMTTWWKIRVQFLDSTLIFLSTHTDQNVDPTSSVFKRSMGILNVLLLRNGVDYSSLNSTEYITVWNITSMLLNAPMILGTNAQFPSQL
jgi:hypothetical protein